MKRYLIIATGLAILLLSSQMVTAETFNVGGSYNSEDTIVSTDMWNEYLVSADSGKEIEYSFDVQGTGRIMVFFVKGHSASLSSDYLILYSQDSPTKSFSKTFSVGSSDGTKFTLLVVSEGDENVTYNAKIKVVDTPITNYIICGAILFLFIFGGSIAAFIIRSRKRKKMQAESPQYYQYQPGQQPQPPVAQQPPAQRAQQPVTPVPEPQKPKKTQPPPPPPPA